MHAIQKSFRLASALAVAVLLTAGSPGSVYAQTPAPSSTSLSEPVVKALQEALTKQGIAVAPSGVLNDETRAAVKKYQSQHHLPVTGEPDKATLDKLGVGSGAASAGAPTLAQATPPTGGMPGQMQMPPQQAPQVQTQPGRMSGDMMQSQMHAMMQMMQGMMGMMQSQMQPGPAQPGQMSGGMMMNCPMMPGQMHGMMQMMQGMMGMMQGRAQMPGQMQPGQMMPGQTPKAP